jgi:hypothetical protein
MSALTFEEWWDKNEFEMSHLTLKTALNAAYLEGKLAGVELVEKTIKDKK